jgi:hypothetical protein
MKLYAQTKLGAPIIYEYLQKDGSKVNVVVGSVSRISDSGDRITGLDIDRERLTKLGANMEEKIEVEEY